MELYLKIAACSVLCAMLCAVLKPREGAISLALAALCAAMSAAAGLKMVQPLLDFFDRLVSFIGLARSVFSPLVKAVAIAMLSRLASAICQDAGQTALAKTAELCGSILCLCAGLPLGEMLLELLERLGG